ncbi:hypothetical protein CIRMBP1287_01767 [Enterococcus cecorum]|uniref:hypothetical protein n=1 Tax=Enterococcus cecorum TaxID=44008 RepID=UPI002491AE1A|nr:hypothetical protein [Enterococcus cecorum]CAI3519997.1 hypothetical protein CIRMBP1287_01767 [Enterococcus cecorum]
MNKYQKFNEMVIDLQRVAKDSDIEFVVHYQADAESDKIYGATNCSRGFLASVICNVLEMEFDVDEIMIMTGAVLAKKEEKEPASKD